MHHPDHPAGPVACDGTRRRPTRPGADAQPDTLDALRWQARPVIVLGPVAQVSAQIAALDGHRAALVERDMVILTDGPGAGALRDGQGFQLLIGKDGGVKLPSATPVAADDILALIDSMPMRRDKMR